MLAVAVLHWPLPEPRRRRRMFYRDMAACLSFFTWGAAGTSAWTSLHPIQFPWTSNTDGDIKKPSAGTGHRPQPSPSEVQSRSYFRQPPRPPPLAENLSCPGSCGDSNLRPPALVRARCHLNSHHTSDLDKIRSPFKFTLGTPLIPVWDTNRD
jgi:hypothetical protein